MQVKYIESFLKLYEELNISRASKKLFITQQGLSRQIKSLEEELGVILFERSKAGVTPTEICKQIYSHLKNIHINYTQTTTILEKYKKEHERKRCISIAFSYGIPHGINTDFLFNYQKKNPNIDIEIQEWSKKVCMEKLLTNEIEIAFLVNPFNTELFNTILLTEGYMYAAMHKAHSLSKYENCIDFSLLNGETIITGSKENALREMFDYFCTLSDIKPHIMVSSSYSLNFVNTMTSNIGIATITSAMASQITNPNVVIRRLLTPEPGYLYCCSSNSIKQNKDITSLLEYIKDYFEKTPILKV